ncbi:hypothetical protein [Levilactobacillus koreensis]|uniref:AbrB family transcriptional regulator n=1 Tax=Levilactobacillus koreensis TaxID=637971 RepID=A0AAC8ZGC2_9LACO|nr:hypothetical protein [Levilactobacillus koreensis]AKP64438.1 hypothetical protein ABN16_05120 [Levilactobacillus koreensis]
MMEKNSNERIIGEYETRRIGHSIVLTVPKKAGIDEKEKYLLIKKNDGSLEYRPVQTNPWLSGTYDDIDFKKINKELGNIDNGSPVGKENVEW